MEVGALLNDAYKEYEVCVSLYGHAFYAYCNIHVPT